MNFSPICQAVPGNVFDSNDTLLYNQSLIVYAPDNSFTHDLMEAVKGHSAFSVRKPIVTDCSRDFSPTFML